ncbi:hypothetical protein [Thalassotalea sp. PLHSN55]|uniref:hypothetical protein n=1 Tax=Thalassotalea sp. PLHSN55 TaxID=3435888 RepID=UPI003F86D644
MKFITLLSTLLLVGASQATSFSYDDIAKRNSGAALTDEKFIEAKMHGECLVGLKKLNFKKNKQFDPIAEWTNFRTVSLLEQFPPCQVLVMMEVAQKELKKQLVSE